MQGSLGGRFPGCLEEIVLGRVRENVDSEKRDTAIIRTVLKRVLIAIKRLHSLGEDPLYHAPALPVGVDLEGLCMRCSNRLAYDVTA